MKNRSLSIPFLEKLKAGGQFRQIREIVSTDPYLNMEFRGNSVIIYYRGGKVMELQDKDNGILLPLDKQYGKIKEELSLDTLPAYISEAKHKIDVYQLEVRGNLGEKEISQRVVFENNDAVFSEDTDYFIVDMEYNDGKQFDLIGINWDCTASAHRQKQISVAVIETKQGMTTLRTTSDNPGIKKHYEDYLDFKKNPGLKDFINDMVMIFKQNCELGLIQAIDKSKSINVDLKTNFKVSNDLDFIVILGNYKMASKNLLNELDELPDDCSCKFAISSFMGYGLFSNSLLSLSELKKKIK